MAPGFLKFEECFMERIWGGDQMRRMLNKAVPSGKTIGESWMISDHAAHISVVSEGPLAGRTLHQLLERDSMALLGVNAAPTRDGKFPLLLKLIDAGQDLSVQVHPDDELAYQLGEQDMGKTEMWHVLETEGQCRIMLGLRAGVTREILAKCLRDGGDVIGLMGQLPVRGGESFHVPSGTVHAIGGGVLLAEIQQNSNVTYRLFDYNRRDADGKRRELHLEKGLQAIRFQEALVRPSTALRVVESGATREFLAACRYFAAEKVWPGGRRVYVGPAGSFHILLSLEASLTLEGDTGACRLQRGEAALVPAAMPAWQVVGRGAYLEYYVPDLKEDVIQPLKRHGYADAQILQLGGVAERNDLSVVLAQKNMKL